MGARDDDEEHRGDTSEPHEVRAPERRCSLSGLNPSLVIFDCDGVLVDSEELQTRVLLEVAGELGFSLSLPEAVGRFRGAKIASTVRIIEEQLGRPTPEDFVLTVRARTARAFDDELRAIEGIHDALESIATPRCVASSGPVEKIEQALRLTKLLGHFEGRIFSSYDIGSWKPAPDLFLHAAARMGARASECVVVEDSVLGVQAGVAAGMRVLGFASDQRARELSAAGAEVFASMGDLAALIRGG
jgi:HAD superfamily hydrolase (TIGR01509 family)